MSAALHLANSQDAPKLLAMVEAYHSGFDLGTDAAARAAALAPLLAGSPHGAVWLIGPRAAPVGYIALTFGWSLAHGGLKGTVDEFFIRDSVRGRGVGTEVLVALIKELEAGGLTSLAVALPGDDSRLARICARLGFQGPADTQVMTWVRGPLG